MSQELIAEASVTIDAPVDEVWSALVNPRAIEQFMFGTNVQTTWLEGSPITWKGDWRGKSYEDKGIILEHEPERRLKYSHFSARSGLPDEPKNYHTVTIDLSSHGDRTEVTLTQDNNRSEEARVHSAENWQTMLDSLRGYVEAGDSVSRSAP